MSTLGHSLWDSGIERQQQGYSRQRVLAINGTKVRLSVYRDSYDFQSRYTAETFDGTKWNGIVHLPGANFTKDEIPNQYAELEARETAVEAMFDRLFEAAQVLLS